jgi:hypothetical protein
MLSTTQAIIIQLNFPLLTQRSPQRTQSLQPNRDSKSTTNKKTGQHLSRSSAAFRNIPQYSATNSAILHFLFLFQIEEFPQHSATNY